MRCFAHVLLIVCFVIVVFARWLPMYCLLDALYIHALCLLCALPMYNSLLDLPMYYLLGYLPIYCLLDTFSMYCSFDVYPCISY